MTWPIGIILFLSIITVTSYLVLRKRSGENFTPVYLLTITIKLLLSAGFVIIFIIADRPAADFNTVFFLIGYVIFTAAEVIILFLKKRG